MSVRLWLVRHGATEWSDRSLLTGWTDIPLNQSGREQARRIGDALRGRDFASVWSSDLRRASETAVIAVGGATPDRRLRELHFGELEGVSWDRCESPIREGLLRFDSFHAPGGESVDDMRSRILEFVQSLPKGDHLVFTHGGVIRLLLREEGVDRHVVPGSVTTIVLRRAPGRETATL